jgi:hypothetical protein
MFAHVGSRPVHSRRARNMYLTNRRFLVVTMLALVLVLTHCQQDGSGEKAGKKVDQAIEKVNR